MLNQLSYHSVSQARALPPFRKLLTYKIRHALWYSFSAELYPDFQILVNLLSCRFALGFHPSN